jgi:hypothetical protein
MNFLPSRFAAIFLKRFSLKEKIIHIGLALGALVFAYERHRAAEQLWEVVAPVVWVLSFSAIWHAIATAIRLDREIGTEQETAPSERESLILTGSGQPATVPVTPQKISFYQLKICGMAAILCLLAVSASYITWKMGAMKSESQATPPAQSSITGQALFPKTPDSDSQYGLLKLNPTEQKKLDSLKGQLFHLKAQELDAPEYYKWKAEHSQYQDEVDDIETKVGCLIDLVKVECLPKPPDNLQSGDIGIDVSTSLVADDLTSSRFWMIRNGTTKVRVPIALFVSLTNHLKDPVKITLLYLQARSVGGWADIDQPEFLYHGE